MVSCFSTRKKKSFENLWTFFAIPIGKIKMSSSNYKLSFFFTGNWRDFKANPVANWLWIGLLQCTEGNFWLRPDDQGLLFPSQGFMKFESFTRFIELKCELGNANTFPSSLFEVHIAQNLNFQIHISIIPNIFLKKKICFLKFDQKIERGIWKTNKHCRLDTSWNLAKIEASHLEKGFFKGNRIQDEIYDWWDV